MQPFRAKDARERIIEVMDKTQQDLAMRGFECGKRPFDSFDKLRAGSLRAGWQELQNVTF